MLAQVILGALITQAVVGAPTNCGEYCDDRSGYGGKLKGSYSSYSKSSSYEHSRRISGGGSGSGGGLGSMGGRLENLDENVVSSSSGGSAMDHPGNWEDEKHYITDDGRGQMSYRAGQTVSNNGFSKFAEHSYSYGSDDHHSPRSNSQVLSTADFNNELQNMRSRIGTFMGNFHMDSMVNANLLQEFKSKANAISNQMNDVCNQVDVGSSMYQQMQQMIQQFQRDVQQRQQQMEAIVFGNSRTSSSSSGRLVHGSSMNRYQSSSRPTSTKYVQQYPLRPITNEDTLRKEQRVDEQISSLQSLISNFYSSFNRPDTNFQYQQDFNTKVNLINQKLKDLSYEAVQSESVRSRIEHMKGQFESYVSQLRDHIEEAEQRNREEEDRRKQQELQLQLEKKQQQEELRRLEEERIRQEEERARQRELEEERLRQQQQEEERARQQELEEERLRQQHQEEERIRQQELEEERVRQQHDEEERIRQQQDDEDERIRMQQEERARLHKQPVLSRPHMSGVVEVSGSSSSSYQRTVKGSYGSQLRGSGANRSRPQPIAVEHHVEPHVDLTAAVSRLQQDLNRLQGEVTHFNMYSMRLTSNNKASIVGEAERQAENLRQNINSLCDTSDKYHDQEIKSSAEELRRRFEEMVQSFHSQAANFSPGSSSGYSASSGYSSESSYGSSGSYGNIRAPSNRNMEIEHSRTTEIEIGRRPASAQRHSSSSGYSSSSKYNSMNVYGSPVDDQLKHGLIDMGGGGGGGGSNSQQVECVEMYAGQPCIRQPRRSKRQAGGK